MTLRLKAWRCLSGPVSRGPKRDQQKIRNRLRVGRNMKKNYVCLRSSLLAVAMAAASLALAPRAGSQEKPMPTGETARSDRFPAAKQQAQPPSGAPRDSDADSQEDEQGKQGKEEKDSPEAIRKRDEWFYKQRSSVNGHIPGGARLKALRHMQRMMAAEGKLVLRADGTYAPATPQAGSTSFPAWSSIGPTPTTGGTFSPVTGRITTIAVDPSDTTGNTVLIGGAQGGIWRSTDAGLTWTEVGDQNASLAMGSIAFAPSSPTTVYAGTGEQAAIGFDIYYGAGVLKSTDHGMTWTQTCTVASTTCPFIGPYTDGLNPGFGFFNFGGAHISYVAVNPTNPNLILVGAQFLVEGPQEGVYCSSNGGATWTNILPDEMATFVGFASSSVAFAALGNPFGSSPGAPNGNGIYKSTNANSCSATFTPLAGGLPAQSTMGRMDLGISPNYASDSTVYASIADDSTSSSTNLGVWLTRNGGTTWTLTAAPDVCQGQCWYDNVVKVDPNNESIAFFGGAAVTDNGGNPTWVVRTTTGGTSWAAAIPNQLGAGLPHVDTHAMAFFKLSTGKVRMYLGNDGGIWRTDDAEAATITWTNLNDSLLTLTQFYPSISINTSSPSIAFAGTQDNGSQNYQGGVAWVDNNLCGDGASTAVDAVIPSTVYIGCATGNAVNASYQNGAMGTFSPAINGINPNDPLDFIPPLITDPNTANVLYFGTYLVYQSQDAGNSWSAISGQLVANGGWLTTLAVEPGNASALWAGANTGQVFVAQTVAGQFSGFIQIGASSLPTRAVTGMAIDPSDPTGNTGYVAYSGFAFNGVDPLGVAVTDLHGHIFKTTNANTGQNVTFVDVSCSTADCSKPAATDLPNIPVNDIVVDPDVPGIIYAATDLGVYVGNCTATTCTWSTLGTALPNVAVLSLRLYEASRTLFAATHGRGVWTIALNNFAFTGPRIFSLTPTSANAGAAQLTLTVNGTGLTGGTVNFGGTALATTVVSDTQLTATIPTGQLAAAASQKVTITVASSTSNSLPFEILGAAASISGCTTSAPASTTASCGTPVQVNPSTNVQITLNGTNIVSGAKVLFNGANSGITTQSATATQLTAAIPAFLLGPYGSTNDIALLNLPPGSGKSKPITLQVVAPAPPNDSFAAAINVPAVSFIDVQDASGATTQAMDPLPPCVTQYTSAQGNTGGQKNGVYNTIWYQFTPVFSANLEVDTIGSSYDTVLSVWTGQPGSLTNIACNDDIQPGVVVQSQIQSVALTAGKTYYIMVSSFGPPDPNPIALGGKSFLNFAYNNGQNPPATITSISPTTAASGGPTFTLSADGTGILSGASVVWGGGPFAANASVPTTVVSQTQATATIDAGLFILPGSYFVSISNPPPGGGATPATVPFTVTVGTYPVPSISFFNPNQVVAGGAAFTMQVVGNNFASNAVLQVNGSARPTTVTFPNQLSAQIPASDIAAPGNLQITVSNPTPGGGPSTPSMLTIVTPNPVPTITSISPTSGETGFGAHVVINGTNFVALPNVYFNGAFVGSTFISSTQLTTDFNIGNLTPGVYPLMVVDPFPGGSATANFTVTGPPDFSLSVATGQSTQTVNAGQTATFTNVITVNAVNGFTGLVNVSCTSPAQATTCALSQNSLMAAQSATVMVTTTARSLAPPLPLNRRMISWPRLVPLIVVMLLCVLLTRLARTRRQRIVAALPLAGFILFLVLQAVGCGGGSSQPPPPPPQTGTLAGTYTITVTGTSTNPNATHTANLQLIVN